MLSILNQRLSRFVNPCDILLKSQISFLPKNRTADHVFTLRTLIDKYVHQHNEKISDCFVDFKKAFDSVCHDGLLYKLLEIGIGGCFYMIKSLCSTSSCAMNRSNSDTTLSLPCSRGVRQGCILSLLFFNLYINDLPFVFEKILSDPIVLPNDTKFNSLLYADDLIMLSRSKTSLQNFLRHTVSFQQLRLDARSEF